MTDSHGKHRWVRWAVPAATLVLLALFARKVDWAQAWSAIAHADPTLLGIATLANLGTLVVKGIRWALFLRGSTDEGIAHLRRAVVNSANTTSWLGQLGEALGLAGRRDEAHDVLRQLEERSQASFVSPYTFAYVYTGLGEADRAIDLLERAVRERTGAAYGIKGSFLFAPLRTHPRFQALLREMRLA